MGLFTEHWTDEDREVFRKRKEEEEKANTEEYQRKLFAEVQSLKQKLRKARKEIRALKVKLNEIEIKKHRAELYERIQNRDINRNLP